MTFFFLYPPTQTCLTSAPQTLVIRRVLSSAKTSWVTSSAYAKLAGKAGSVTKVRVHSPTPSVPPPLSHPLSVPHSLITPCSTCSLPTTHDWELSHTSSLSWDKTLMDNLSIPLGNPLPVQGGMQQPQGSLKLQDPRELRQPESYFRTRIEKEEMPHGS